MTNTDIEDFNPFSGPELLAVIPLTEAQSEIWASTLMDKTASLCYNESFSVHLKGKLDTSLLADSIQDLINQHESLRAAISADGAYMHVYRELTPDIPVLDAPELGSDEWNKILSEKTSEIYDLVNGPLFKTYIFRHNSDEYTLLMMSHHIICDGWSIDVLLDHLSQIYTARVFSKSPSFDTPFQFSEYAEYLLTQDVERKNSEDYWKGLFSAGIPPLELPVDYIRPGIRTYRAARTVKRINEDLLVKIKNLVSVTQSSLFTVLLAAWGVHISRLTNQNQIVIGVPFAGQPGAGMNDLVGHCVSLLPILVNVDGDNSFVDQIKKTKSVILDAYDHQHISFGSLLQKIRIERDPSRIPLISISFTHTQKYSRDKIKFGDCEVNYQLNPRFAETFEIHLNAVESANSIDFLCHYNTSLFDGETIGRFLDGLEEFFKSAIAGPEAQVNSLNIIPDEELHKFALWNTLNTGKTDDQKYNECIDGYLVHNLFEDIVLKNPAGAAAYCGTEKITYKELDEKSNQLANYLKSINISDGDVVGISIERSLNMLVSVLGVLKAGGCYLPLDPAFPDERTGFMYKDSSAKVLITQNSLSGKFRNFDTKILYIDNEWPLISGQKPEKPADTINNRNLAYMIYTSGTTGKPKGVKVHHQAVVNFLLSMSKEPGLTGKDRLLAVTTLSFDISVLELFLPLATGASVVIAGENELIDALSISSLLEKFDITVLQATPATWNILVGSGWKGKKNLKALCGGEAISLKLVRELLPLTESVWNMYGPTETTVWSTCYRFNGENPRILVGRPVDNTRVFILNAQNNIQPIGVTGEVCIGGLGVTSGYHNRDILTSERFTTGPDGKLIYKTGDLGRYLNDGNIELFGRRDDQIKLRGFRIEPGEIENVLCKINGIEEAVVKIHKSGDFDEKLIAHIVTSDGREINNRDINNILNSELPKYMIPSAFIKYKEFPRTPNGKIDKKGLKFNPDDITSDKKIKSPENEIQLAVFNIWSEVLKIKNFGIDDNFFDLGGHSLLVAEVQNRLKQSLKAEIAIIDLFTHPTIKSIAELLSGEENNSKKINSMHERAKMQRKALSVKNV